jgi:hypothetical protein
MSLAQDWNSGGSALIPGTGKPGLRDLLSPLHGLSGLTALKAVPESESSDGAPARVLAGAARGGWRYHAASVLAGDDVMVVAPADGRTAGRWIREVGSYLDIALAFTFATLDAASLYALPTGFELDLLSSAWEIGTSMTGGTTPAIGISSGQTGLSTKGDILGGAAGDLTATLVSTGAKYKGTTGAKMGTPSARLVGGNGFRFDRIADAFAAGAGTAHIGAAVIVVP